MDRTAQNPEDPVPQRGIGMTTHQAARATRGLRPAIHEQTEQTGPPPSRRGAQCRRAINRVRARRYLWRRPCQSSNSITSPCRDCLGRWATRPWAAAEPLRPMVATSIAEQAVEIDLECVLAGETVPLTDPRLAPVYAPNAHEGARQMVCMYIAYEIRHRGFGFRD